MIHKCKKIEQKMKSFPSLYTMRAAFTHTISLYFSLHWKWIILPEQKNPYFIPPFQTFDWQTELNASVRMVDKQLLSNNKLKSLKMRSLKNWRHFRIRIRLVGVIVTEREKGRNAQNNVAEKFEMHFDCVMNPVEKSFAQLRLSEVMRSIAKEMQHIVKNCIMHCVFHSDGNVRWSTMQDDRITIRTHK